MAVVSESAIGAKEIWFGSCGSSWSRGGDVGLISAAELPTRSVDAVRSSAKIGEQKVALILAGVHGRQGLTRQLAIGGKKLRAPDGALEY